MRENIIVLDFGGQYNQLIARRVRECNVYCEVHPYTIELDELKEMAPSGIILTGGPNSVYGEDSPQCNPEIFKLGIPVFGICYGAQLLAHQLGGKVADGTGQRIRKNRDNCGRSQRTSGRSWHGRSGNDRLWNRWQHDYVDEPHGLYRNPACRV